MSQNNNASAFFPFVIIISFIAFTALMSFSNLLGVDWQVGLQIIKGLTILAVLSGLWFYFIGLNSTLPIFTIIACGALISFFPAFDVWAITENQRQLLLISPNWADDVVDIKWYGNGLWQAVMVIIVFIIGYLLEK
jgi:hypothetical protein